MTQKEHMFFFNINPFKFDGDILPVACPR